MLLNFLFSGASYFRPATVVVVWVLHCSVSINFYTGQQSITEPHRDEQNKQPCTLTLTPRVDLDSPITLTCMFWDGGRKTESPHRTHSCTGRTYKRHTESPSQNSNQERNSANHHTTVQPNMLSITSGNVNIMQEKPVMWVWCLHVGRV